MNLYEITSEYLNILNNLEVDEDGCIVNIEEFESIRDSFDSKTENLALFVKSLVSDAEAIKKEEETLYARRKAKENLAERLKLYMTDSFNRLEKTNFETPKCKVSFRKSESVNVIDMDLLPESFKKVKTTIDPDKTAIKNAIKSGSDIPGAVLETKQNIQIK